MAFTGTGTVVFFLVQEEKQMEAVIAINGSLLLMKILGIETRWNFERNLVRFQVIRYYFICIAWGNEDSVLLRGLRDP